MDKIQWVEAPIVIAMFLYGLHDGHGPAGMDVTIIPNHIPGTFPMHKINKLKFEN